MAIANINQFLTDILSSPDFHIPIEANFVVSFDKLNQIINNLNINNLNSIIPDNIIKTGDWNKVKDGYDIFFANGVTVPGETVNSSKAGFSAGGDGLYGGLLSGPVLTGRANLTNFEITFLETSQSFADQVIRPWIVNAAHYGLFARKDLRSIQNFKTDVTVAFKKNTSSDSGNPVNRKIIVFKDAVPTSMEGYSANYGGSKVATRNIKTTWIYSTYEIR